MKKSLSVALVHNSNQERNTYIRPSINSLIQVLTDSISVNKVEVSYQSSIVPHSDKMSFVRDFMYLKLSYKWRKYRQVEFSKSILDLFRFLKNSFAKYVLLRSTVGIRWRRNSAIEVAVTDKHIRVWTEFLDGNADWLICFEDDAVFKQDSADRILRLLTQLESFVEGKYLYVDLAGGCNLNDLRIEKLQVRKDESYRYYSKPVTNTACAYMINRKLADKFHSILTINPSLRLLGIDWLMNNCFILMRKESSDSLSICMHSEPTIFKHGTTTGDYVSWQAD